MALTTYIANTRDQLQNPNSESSGLYTDANLTRWINIARGQAAAEAECIRTIGTIATVIGQRAYNFSSIDIGVAATTGRQGVIHVRRVSYNVGDGQQWMTPRNWEWFDLYCLNNPVPVNGPPQTWSQYGQGSAGTSTVSNSSGSFYIDPPPDISYVLNCDCVCYPTALVDDTTVEAIPYLWSDAIPWFAAYYALMSAQTGQRDGQADRKLAGYTAFMTRARQAANPSVNRFLYQQTQDATMIAKLGLQNKSQ